MYDPISNQFELTAMNIEYDFGLKADDVTSYKGIKSNDNGPFPNSRQLPPH